MLTSVFPCQNHSTNAQYPFIHLPPTLFNVSLPVLQFSPVSTIPPLLHTHSFTYHPRYIMFLSQYSSFPCQYHSTIAPYPFIHLPPTLYNVSVSVFRLFPVSTIPPLLHTHLYRIIRLFVRRTNGRSVKTAMRIGLFDIGAAPNITVLRSCLLCHCILGLFIPHTGVR